VPEYKVLSRKSEPKREEVQHSGEIYVGRNFVIFLHSLLNISRVKKINGEEWAGHIAGMEKNFV
jgi:hypothetical protein